jgi:hypothetical protein
MLSTPNQPPRKKPRISDAQLSHPDDIIILNLYSTGLRMNLHLWRAGAMKEKLYRPNVNTSISSHVGVDWLTIKAAKEAGRHKQDVNSHLPGVLVPDKLPEQTVHKHEKLRS